MRAKFQPVRTAGDKRVICHPHNGAFELVSYLWRIVSSGDNITARAIYFVIKAQGDRLASNGFLKLAIKRYDFFDRSCLARWQNTNGVARVDRPCRDLAGKSPEIEIRSIDPLDSHTQRLGLVRVIIERNRLQMRH